MSNRLVARLPNRARPVASSSSSVARPLRAGMRCDRQSGLIAGMLAAALITVAPQARADAPQVNAALLFLQASCQLRDAKMDARRQDDGRLHLTLRTPQFTRVTNLVHNDLRLFTEESMKRNAEVPPEMGACLDPGVNAIINVLMELPPNVASIPLAPTAAAAPAGGGYVPPMLAQASPPPPPVVATVTAQPAPMAQAVSGGDASGPLRLSFATVEINPERHSSWSGHLVGTVGIDIVNNSGGMLRVAIVDPWPVVCLLYTSRCV